MRVNAKKIILGEFTIVLQRRAERRVCRQQSLQRYQRRDKRRRRESKLSKCTGTCNDIYIQRLIFFYPYYM